MKNLIKTIKEIWAVEELRKRIIYTLGLVLVYRIGSFIVLPGIDAERLASSAAGDNSILNLINMFAGGAFSRASIMALGIMPYISASIVMQLLGMAVPTFQRLQREGESGRKKINQYTRLLTIAICLFQAPSYMGAYVPAEARLNDSFFWWFEVTAILTAGTMFVTWLGERITDRGIGNGISLLITVGIIASLPQSFAQEFTSRVFESNGGLILILIELVVWVIVIGLCVLLVLAVRQIPVQYARRTRSGSLDRNQAGTRQYIPLRLNASGVMPIIFAQAIMFAPVYLGQLLGDSNIGLWMQASFSDMFGLWYNILFGLLIVGFTFFYTAITVPTNKMSDDLKRSGGFVPGIRPGSETSEFLDKVMSLITFPGSLFLAALSVLPAIVVQIMDMQQGWALFYGGTSLLIMVGVAIDTIQQINAYLLNRHYDGLMKTGKNRKLA